MSRVTISFLSICLYLFLGCQKAADVPKPIDSRCGEYNARGLALLDSALIDTGYIGLSARAIAYFDSAVQCAPDQMLYYDNLSRASARIGDRQGAITAMLAALEVFPHDPGLLFKTGIYFEVKGDTAIAEHYYSAAGKGYDRLSALYPDSMRIRINRIGILPFTQGLVAALDSLDALDTGQADPGLESLRQWLEHFDRSTYVQEIGSN